MRDRPPVRWLLWHPHQGVANGRLLGVIRRRVRPQVAGRALAVLVIHCDTSLRTAWAVLRRLVLCGPRHLLSRVDVPDDVDVVYIDLGTHEHGAELRLVNDDLLAGLGSRRRSYGFEASRPSFDLVSQRFSGDESTTLVHAALCLAVPADGSITLFKHDNSLSDSIHRTSDHRERVPAVRLSDFLHEHEPDLARSIVLLRMNIEGAEVDVLQDLIDYGITDHIDGYFGMWDDMSKIDVSRDRAFRKLLRERRITHCTFNGRDVDWPSRMRFIAYEFGTAVLKGRARLQRATR